MNQIRVALTVCAALLVALPVMPPSASAADTPPQINCVARIAKGLSHSQGFRNVRYKVRGSTLSVSGISGNIAISKQRYMRGIPCWMGKSGGKTFGICQRSRDILAFYGAGVQLSPTSVKFANCY